MTPLGEPPSFESGGDFKPTALEYMDEKGVYVHAAASGEEARRWGGNWRQPLTSLVLAPKSRPGSRVTYGFKFRWAEGYDRVRDILYEEGLLTSTSCPA
jgi:hypothetical protein